MNGKSVILPVNPPNAMPTGASCGWRWEWFWSPASAVAVIGLWVAGCGLARGADQTWDNGAANFIWSTGQANWATGAVWTPGNNAIFGATGAGTIDVDGAVSVKDLTFSVNGYVIADADNNGTLTLDSGSTISVSPGVSATISESLDGSNGFTKTGTGTLILSGTNAYTGTTSINLGIVRLTNGSALGGSTSVLMTAGAQLELSGGHTFGTGSSITIDGQGTNFAGSLQSTGGTNIWAGGVVIGASQARIGAQTGATLQVSGVISGAIGVQLSIRNQDQTGTTILSGANTYNASTFVLGRLSVASIGSVGSLSSNLGAPTTAGNAQINLGIGANTATLIYTGSGESTNRVIRLDASDLSGATLDQSGTGLLQFTSNFSANATAVGTRTLTLQGSTAGSGEISGIIGNAGANAIAVAKSGSGTWTLSGANTFTGGLTLNGGTLQLGSTGALNSTAGSENAVTFGAASTGILSLNGRSVTVSNLTSNATPGTPVVQNGNAANATLTVGNALNSGGTFAGVIQDGAGGGGLSLSKAGTGTLILTGANVYTGTTTIGAGGTLQLGSGGTTGSIAGSSAVSNDGTLTINRSDANTFANTITGSGQLVKSGLGDLTLSGSGNSYTGGTFISGANNLILGSNGALGNGPLTFTNATTARLWLSGTNQTITGLSTSGAAGLVVIQNQGGGSGTLTFDLADGVTSSTTGNFFFRDQAGGTGTLALIKTGAGTLDFSTYNSMSYTGGLTVNDGRLAFSISTAMGAGSVTLGGGTLEVTSGASLTIARPTTLTAATTSGIDTGSGTVTYSGTITGAGGLTKSGDGSLVLSGASNAYSGGTDIAAGTVSYNSIGALGTGPVTFTGNSTLQAGVLGAQANAIVIDDGVSGTFDTQGFAASLSGIVSGAGTLVKVGTSSLTLSNGANSYSGGTSLSAGTLIYDDVAAVGTGPITFTGDSTLRSGVAGTLTNAISIDDGVIGTVDTQANNLTLSGDLTGAGQMVKKGGGILYLSSASNTFSGGLLIENANSPVVGPTAYGVVLLADNAAGSGPLTIGNASTSQARFSLNGYDQTVSALSSGSSGIRVVEANGITGGPVSNLTVDQATDTTYTGFFRDQNTGGGKLALVKTGSGFLDLSGAQTASTYSGGLTVDGGTLGFAATTNVGSGPITLGGGTLRYTPTGTTSLTIPNSSVALTAATTSTVEVTDVGATLTLSGLISGGGAVTKSGAGTLTLTGNNSYDGATSVSAGTLLINGDQSSADGQVSIDLDAVLGGTGTIGGNTIVHSGATLTAGTVGGIDSYDGGSGGLAFGGNLTAEAGSTWLVDLNHANQTGDFIKVTGVLDLGGSGGAILDLVGQDAWVYGTYFLIAEYGSLASGSTFQFMGSPLADGQTFSTAAGQYQIRYSDDGVFGDQGSGQFISLTAVPEPSSVFAVVLLVCGAVWMRQRSRVAKDSAALE